MIELVVDSGQTLTEITRFSTADPNTSNYPLLTTHYSLVGWAGELVADTGPR